MWNELDNCFPTTVTMVYFPYNLKVTKLQAELVPLLDPSLTEQYEYASEHDLKCLIIITEAGLSQTGLVKVIVSFFL